MNVLGSLSLKMLLKYLFIVFDDAQFQEIISFFEMINDICKVKLLMIFMIVMSNPYLL